MNIVSLFDGMSCGQIALNKSKKKIDFYFASEIDKYAISVTQSNYKNTIQVGDVIRLRKCLHASSELKERFLKTSFVTSKYKQSMMNAIDILSKKIDLLIGGSPCQGFSFAGLQLNFNDPRSKLFFEFVKIKDLLKPKHFLLENVKMKKEYQNVISEFLGVEPIEINSNLVSAQNRKRLYWTNIEGIKQPNDNEILLQDIVEDGGVLKEKSQTILSTIYKENAKSMFVRNKQGLLVVCGAMRGRYIVDGKRQDGKMRTKGLTKQRIEIRYDGKTNALTTVAKDNNVCYGTDGRSYYEIDGINFRKLTVIECERLQTVPDNYTDYVSNTQRYKMLGNGWTVDVIAHIFSYLN